MIGNNKKIAILLAAYNGCKYLSELLDSLYRQTFTDWTLYVRDDMSTDNTMEIIDAYKVKHDNIVIIYNDSVKLGPQMNFMTLLEVVNSNYYMFMDQDDVWFPDKIEKEYNKIKEIDNQGLIPSLVYTNMKLVDGQLNIVSESFWQSIHHSPNAFNNLQYYAFMCYITGCTMLFNNAAKQLAFPIAKYSLMHDWWIAICVYKNNGNVGYIEKPTMLYRKHGNNATGDMVYSQANKSIWKRFNEMINQYYIIRHLGLAHTFLRYVYLKYRINVERRKY